MTKQSIVKTRARQRGKWVISVQRSNKHMRVQVVNPQRQVVGGVSTLSPVFVQATSKAKDEALMDILAKCVVELVKKHGLEETHWAFDRSGRSYHGKIKSLCDALRTLGMTI